MIFESGKNGANLVTSCRNCRCWTRLTVAARNNLVTLRPGGRREEGYVIATSADMVSLDMTPDPDNVRHALFLTVGDT